MQTVATIGTAAELFERAFIFDMPNLAEFDDADFDAWNSAVWAHVPRPPIPAAPSDEPEH